MTDAEEAFTLYTQAIEQGVQELPPFIRLHSDQIASYVRDLCKKLDIDPADEDFWRIWALASMLFLDTAQGWLRAQGDEDAEVPPFIQSLTSMHRVIGYLTYREASKL